MTDDVQNEEAPKAPAEYSGPLAGERLADARRQQSITIVEVAKELHLDEHKVRALEQNEFDVLGAPVFAKGHLKKYAQLVGVPIEDVLADYYALNRSSGMPPVVGAVRKPASELTPGPWLAIIVVVIVAATAYWYFIVSDGGNAAVVDSPAGSVSMTPPSTATGTAAGAASEPAATGDDPQDTGVVLEPAAAETVAAAAGRQETAPPVVLDSPPAPPDGQVSVTLEFSGDCWTEVTDAGGRKLFFDLGRAGRVRTITGRAPLAVLLGNADNVSVRVNGEVYAMAAGDRRGETARLTIRVPE